MSRTIESCHIWTSHVTLSRTQDAQEQLEVKSCWLLYLYIHKSVMSMCIYVVIYINKSCCVYNIYTTYVVYNIYTQQNKSCCVYNIYTRVYMTCIHMNITYIHKSCWVYNIYTTYIHNMTCVYMLSKSCSLYIEKQWGEVVLSIYMLSIQI